MRRRVSIGAALAFAVAAYGLAAQTHPPPSRQPPSRQARARPAGPTPAAHVFERSIPDLQQAMAEGKASSRELVEAYLARIRAYDEAGPALNALIALNPRALDEAAALDRERAAKGPRGPLHGIPVLIKDNYETEDTPTTGGSIALAGFRTGRDAALVARLRAAGAVVIGKTNMHELAAGITTISSLGGQTRNPYDPTRNPGGSSGGTGAAVAASFGAAGMGSDTCGSIRIPSANNNLFGLRGTLGLTSRAGIIPLSHTQDIGGPLARTVTDLAIMLDAIAGADPADATTAASAGHVPRSYRDGLRAGALEGARIGVLQNAVGGPDDPDVAAVVRHMLEELRAGGAELIDVTIPGLDEQLQGSSVIDSEFKFDLMDYLGRFPNAPVHSLGEILERGQYAAALEQTFRHRNSVESRDSEEYRRARLKRQSVRHLVDEAFDEHRLDGLIYPTLRRRIAAAGDPQLGSTCQISAASGLPVVAMPAGFTADGLPVGVDLLGSAWSEPRLLALAYAYEQAVHPRRPPPTTPALVDGHAPPPVAFETTIGSGAGAVRVSFHYDPVSGRLRWEIPKATASRLLAAAIHRVARGAGSGADASGSAARPAAGAVIARLVNPADADGAGDVVLEPRDREALRDGNLLVVVAPREGARSAAVLQMP
ncbi:MAG: amidase family protein [Betaproteobacteria bacterium]